MTKFYNNRLDEVSIYLEHCNEDPFYTTHCLSNYFSEDFDDLEITTRLLHRIKYNLPLIAQYYHTVSGIEYVNREDMCQKVQSKFESHLIISRSYRYYTPRIWDEKIALECDLMPFQFGKMNLLSPGGFNNEINVLKLEAYQLLAYDTIDEGSDFFTEPQQYKKNVANVLREETAEKVFNKLSQAISPFYRRF